MTVLAYNVIKKYLKITTNKHVKQICLIETVWSMSYLSASLDELSCVKVVEYILDRNACLLPAYFAVTEIRKLYPEDALSHWVTHS